MLYKIYSFMLILFFSLSVASQSDTVSLGKDAKSERGTLEYENNRAISAQKIYNVGRALTYSSIIPMYIGSIGGGEVAELGVAFIPVNAVYGLTALTINHIGMARSIRSLRRASEALPENKELKDEVRRYRIRYINGGICALAGATSMTFGAVLGPIEGPQWLIPLSLAGYALIGLRDVFWTKAIKGSIKIIGQARTPHSKPEIISELWIPTSGGLGMRVSFEL